LCMDIPDVSGHMTSSSGAGVALRWQAMSEADDLLREASDPTTPGERLRDLAAMQVGGRPGLHPRWAHVQRAAAVNPAIPVDWLRGVLASTSHPLAPVAWFNPIVPLLLQAHPSPDYWDAAFGLLQRLADSEGIRLSVRACSLQATISEIAAADQRAPEATELAAHIADLLGLTWGEP
jgi:hypothetical protein